VGQQLLKTLPAHREQIVPPYETRESGYLGGPPGTVIVHLVAFVDTVAVGRHPGYVLFEPVLQSCKIAIAESAHRFQHLDASGDFDEMDGVDDAHATAGHPAFDSLAVQQARVHTRAFVEKPRLQMQNCPVRVYFFAGHRVGGGQRRYPSAQVAHGQPVLGEVARICLAVLTDVRTVGVIGVGPPVIAFGIEVVDTAGTPLRHRLRDWDRFLRKVTVSFLKNPFVIECHSRFCQFRLNGILWRRGVASRDEHKANDNCQPLQFEGHAHNQSSNSENFLPG